MATPAAAEFLMNQPAARTQPDAPRGNGHNGGGNRPPNVTPIRGGDQSDDMPDEHNDQAPDDEQERPRGERVRRNQILDRADHDEDVEFPQNALRGMTSVLSHRQVIIRELQKDGDYALSAVEKQIMSLTPEDISQMAEGNLNAEKLAIAEIAIADELIQKYAALGLVSNDVGVRRREGRFIGRLIRRRRIEAQEEATNQRLQNEYTRFSGSPRELRLQIQKLNEVRFSIETALYGNALRDDMFYSGIRTSLHPIDSTTSSEHILRATFNKEIGEIMQQRYDGEDIADLFDRSPTLAIQVQREALQRSALRYNDELAKQIISGEKPDVDETAIKHHKDAVTGKPDQQKITELATQKDQKVEEERLANETVTRIKAELKTYQDIERRKNTAEKNHTNAENRLQAIRDEIARRENPSLAARIKGKVAGTKNAKNRDFSELDLPSLKTLASQTQTEVDRLQNEFDETEYAFNNIDQTKRSNLQSDLQTAETAASTARTARTTADNNLNTEKNKTTQKNEDEVKAYDRWLKILSGENYNVIIGSRFNYDTNAQDPYSRTHLGSTKLEGGQIEGAEKIREIIFRNIDIPGYSPELARQMLNDEVLARAMISHFKIPVDDLGITDLEMLSGNELLERTLPFLKNANPGQIASMLQVIVNKGLQGAEHGQPFLHPDDFPGPGEPPSPTVNPRPPSGQNPPRPLPPQHPAPNTPDSRYYDMSMRPGYVNRQAPPDLPRAPEPPPPAAPTPPAPFVYSSGRPLSSQVPATNQPGERYFDTSLRPGYADRQMPPDFPRAPELPPPTPPPSPSQTPPAGELPQRFSANSPEADRAIENMPGGRGLASIRRIMRGRNNPANAEPNGGQPDNDQLSPAERHPSALPSASEDVDDELLMPPPERMPLTVEDILRTRLKTDIDLESQMVRIENSNWFRGHDYDVLFHASPEGVQITIDGNLGLLSGRLPKRLRDLNGLSDNLRQAVKNVFYENGKLKDNASIDIPERRVLLFERNYRSVPGETIDPDLIHIDLFQPLDSIPTLRFSAREMYGAIGEHVLTMPDGERQQLFGDTPFTVEYVEIEIRCVNGALQVTTSDGTEKNLAEHYQSLVDDANQNTDRDAVFARSEEIRKIQQRIGSRVIELLQRRDT